jgi:predicted small secreted protein
MRKSFILAAAIATLALAACNTVSGAGRDVSSVGKATTVAAEKAKN